jgi:hypothetical protein
MPIAEPFCEFDATVRCGTASLTHLDVRRTEFVERAHHLLDRLVFDPRTVFDRKVI